MIQNEEKSNYKLYFPLVIVLNSIFQLKYNWRCVQKIKFSVSKALASSVNVDGKTYDEIDQQSAIRNFYGTKFLNNNFNMLTFNNDILANPYHVEILAFDTKIHWKYSPRRKSLVYA